MRIGLVSEAFYRASAELPPSQQVIILGNENPDARVAERINYVHFWARLGVDCYGFYPHDADDQTSSG